MLHIYNTIQLSLVSRGRSREGIAYNILTHRLLRWHWSLRSQHLFMVPLTVQAFSFRIISSKLCNLALIKLFDSFSPVLYFKPIWMAKYLYCLFPEENPCKEEAPSPWRSVLFERHHFHRHDLNCSVRWPHYFGVCFSWPFLCESTIISADSRSKF